MSATIMKNLHSGLAVGQNVTVLWLVKLLAAEIGVHFLDSRHILAIIGPFGWFDIAR